MEVLIWIFYKILVPVMILGVAINIHEFGHFIVARFFKMRVEAYSFFGLGPRIWGFKRGNTDYRISAIPLGAYVKLYGDEATAGLEGGSSDGEKVPDSELYELRPRWQKFFVMLGGPFMNIVLALSIPLVMALTQGVPKVPEPIIGIVEPNGVAEQAGLKQGDKIVAFNGAENPDSNRIRIDAAINPDKSLPITVERNGEKINLQITPKRKEIISGQEGGDLEFQTYQPVIIGQVEANMPAEEAGLKVDDKIIKVNEIAAQNFLQVRDLVQKYKDQPINLTIERNGTTQVLTASVRQTQDGTQILGFRPKQILEPASFGTAMNYAFSFNWENVRATGTVLGQLFSGQRSAKDSGISGPIGIFRQSSDFAQTMGWEGALVILTGISLSLGIMNLLPIPMLDGGQIMLLGIEKVYSWFGKTLSLGMKERINLVGFATIMLLMVSVMFLDISKLFK
jgi:regulator of sigma E protease